MVGMNYVNLCPILFSLLVFLKSYHCGGCPRLFYYLGSGSLLLALPGKPLTHTQTHTHTEFEGTKADLDQSIPVPPSSNHRVGLNTPLFSIEGHILFRSQFLLLAPMGAMCGPDDHRLSAGVIFFKRRLGWSVPKQKTRNHIHLPTDADNITQTVGCIFWQSYKRILTITSSKSE